MKSMQAEVRRATMMVLAAALLLSACQPRTVTVTREVTRQVEVTVVVTQPAGPLPSPTPNQRSTPASASIPIAPYPDAPLCPDTGLLHHNVTFHTLWDSVRGCHYDHEHGTNPSTPEVAATFPGFDVHELLGGFEIGHTNPSSPTENAVKHGGFKWNVQLHHPETCVGFESAETGVDGSVIQYHGFGDYSIEAEVRIHSTVALLRQCQSSNPTDYGYVFVNQLQDYGQRITPYQGTILPYPNQPDPPFPSGKGPYFSFNCVDLVAPYDMHCRAGSVQAQTSSAVSNWTSKVTGDGHSDMPSLFRLLWRVRDTYKEIHLDDWPNASYPFEFLWLCSDDIGQTFNPEGCEYNNSTTQVHEIAGTIPVAWDDLAGWDTNPAAGRITADGYVDSSGAINLACTEPSTDCFPIKLVNAFTGTYGSVLVFTEGKGTNIVPNNPERDIYFCGGQVCAEGDPGAVPSGWLGPSN